VQNVFLTYPDLRDHGIKFTRVHINWLIARGQFPAAVWLSANRKVWIRSEIERFLASRPRSRPALQTAVEASDAA
jgi:predicted DNA-binding transcriptional regulator AlpA